MSHYHLLFHYESTIISAPVERQFSHSTQLECERRNYCYALEDNSLLQIGKYYYLTHLIMV